MQTVTTQIEPDGPFITAIVGVSKPREEAIEHDGGIVPARKKVRLLIDTGASGTCIDQSILAELEIGPKGFDELIAASSDTPVSRAVYDVSLWIPISSGTPDRIVSRGMAVMECRTARFGYQGILGRDVLATCVLTYDGPEGIATLRF